MRKSSFQLSKNIGTGKKAIETNPLLIWHHALFYNFRRKKFCTLYTSSKVRNPIPLGYGGFYTVYY
jgi:hypothetical protein